MKELKINQEIDASTVMLIDEEGKSQGEVSVDQALYLAHNAELDLVQVSVGPKGVPITKIMDYGKYRYAQGKQESKQKVKGRSGELKEVWLSLKISAHDLDFKAKQAQKFLTIGDKVKVTVKLLGREMMFSSRVRSLLDEFKTKAGGEFESDIERLGNRFSVILKGSKNEAKNIENRPEKN